MLRFLLLALLLLPVVARAASVAERTYTTVSLIAETPAPAAGRPVTLGLVMQPKPGWHTYWRNPGSSGYETRVSWTLPRGAAAGAFRYPLPKTFAVAGLTSYVYERENVLLADLTLPAGLAPGTPLLIRAKLDWLVCNDQLCVPESATLSLDLVVGNGRRDPVIAERFAAARAALPKPVAWPARFAVKGEQLVLNIPFAQLDQIRGAYFFPHDDGVLRYSAPQTIGKRGSQLVLATLNEQAQTRGAISGLLRIDLAGRDEPLAVELTARRGDVQDAAVPIAGANDAGGEGTPTAAFAFLAAIVGGLLLNIMPCVFPILSLKALSLARAGTSEQEARREALAYSAGVILTCLALGGAILALRAGGASVGWAFQLQDPRVIAGLMLLMVAIGLNLAGLYEVTLSARDAGGSLAARPGPQGAFWTGVLAAFVATPCTGPFMGLALGAAVILPPLLGLLIFAGLGLGIALPFLAVGFVPALRRRLPRPGAWMTTLRRLLSVPMFLTALALAWVLGRQAGVEGMTIGLGAALALGLALWWLGLRQSRMSERRSLAPLALGAAAVATALLLVAPNAQPRAAELPLAAVPFTPARLDTLRAEGKPTFVYFTADWCITCKVNERGALSNAAVTTAFREAGVAVLVGDYTNGDPAIDQVLATYGRAGIPLYLFFAPSQPAEILPQILTTGTLLDLVA